MKFKLILIFIFCYSYVCFSQNDLLSLIDNNTTEYSNYIFKGTKVVNSESVEMPDNGVLQFMIQHRFGTLNSGFYNFYGLDNSQVRMSLAYGINDRLSIGIGRSSSLKAIDSNLKYQLFRQSKGNKTFPLTICLNSSIVFKQYFKSTSENSIFLLSDQFSYSHQLLIARKINRKFSIQLSPTLVHYNLLSIDQFNNDLYSIGYGLRYKLSNRISVNLESFSQFNSQNKINPISIGFDVETGGHVFQFHLSNSAFMINRAFIHETYDLWSEGSIYFGFNISRVFTVKE
ncbi:MAG: DUF5777 family beta-barrel protein [Flavobacteriales bacterium]|jgi:hypothetical protein|tara:strand:+ start:715 stop:1575 length:861 start_codon:yes stop_codon:yes gene_type:complete